MGYIFKEKILYREYDKFIKNYSGLSFMQEERWAKTKEYKNYLIVGAYKNDELCAVAQIIINKKKNGYQFFIPNGYLLDFNNLELVSFMTENIKALARKYQAYVVDIYPYITTVNNNYSNIHNNLLANHYMWTNEYIDQTNNIILSLYKNGKKITKTELKKKYDKKDFYLKRGITFDVSDSLEDIKRLKELINDDYFDESIVGNLMINFEGRIKIILAKINLPFYLGYLIDHQAPVEQRDKINELIDVIGDEMNIGGALLILPYNPKINSCEYIYNTVNEFFTSLDIAYGLFYEAIKEAHQGNCQSIKASNISLDTAYYVSHFEAIPIQYIGHYSLILNKLKYFLNKEVKRKKENSN